MVQLRDKEQKMREFKKLIDKKKQEFGIHFWEKYGPRQSCLDQIDKYSVIIIFNAVTLITSLILRFNEFAEKHARNLNQNIVIKN